MRNSIFTSAKTFFDIIKELIQKSVDFSKVALNEVGSPCRCLLLMRPPAAR